MYKLLIVEDERWEREGLVDFLNWSELEISIVGAAVNGLQGLELAEKYNPDIIITDIKMPIIDGIEFSGKVRDFLPDCRIIIVTGYDDFEYAKVSIQLGVNVYLLKPVRKDELLNALKRIVKDISEDISREKYISGLKQQIAERRYLNKERFLLHLLDGDLSDQEAEGGYIFPAGQGIVAVVIRFNVNSIFRGKEYILRQSIFNDLLKGIREAVGDEGIAVQNNAGMHEIIVCLPSGDDGRDYIHDVIRRIMQACIGTEGPGAVIGIGSVSKTLQGFPASVEQAISALDYIFFMKDADIFFFDDISPTKVCHEEELYNLLAEFTGYTKKVMNGITSLDPQGVAGLSEELFSFIPAHSIDKDTVCNYIAGLFSEISALLLSHDISFVSQMVNEDIVATLHGFVRIEDMKNWFEGLLLHATDCIAKQKGNKEEYIVRKVMEIIENEYRNSIGIKTIARRLELSPNYLGKLFMQNKEIHFTEYLTSYRIKKAEALLVSGQQNEINIAKSVGYVNVAHFCKVFKKIHGISPMEYRNIHIKENEYGGIRDET